MEPGEFFSRSRAVLDAREELSNDDQVNDQWRSKERVFADGVHGDGVATTHHELGMILIHCDLGVSDCGNIFDDNAVVDGPSVLVVEENLIGSNDVINNGRLGNLLGTELTWCGQVLAIIISCC